ncbi:hypothetical protein ZHAS_00011602 [Anopheles sinensis]|uniref:Uncharacterized protein n=1 Tax=Anopheles sinensis TaxID=74873 RepID=A0A084W0P1_ANOSI|nr:hypothetical protein ZHAS_00011602 [Anopheles sinensis]
MTQCNTTTPCRADGALASIALSAKAGPLLTSGWQEVVQQPAELPGPAFVTASQL